MLDGFQVGFDINALNFKDTRTETERRSRSAEQRRVVGIVFKAFSQFINGVAVCEGSTTSAISAKPLP